MTSSHSNYLLEVANKDLQDLLNEECDKTRELKEELKLVKAELDDARRFDPVPSSSRYQDQYVVGLREEIAVLGKNLFERDENLKMVQAERDDAKSSAVLAKNLKYRDEALKKVKAERDDARAELNSQYEELGELQDNVANLEGLILKLQGVPEKTCVLCEETYVGYGNNADPVAEGLCCDDCNNGVIATRLGAITKEKNKDGVWEAVPTKMGAGCYKV